MSNDDGEIQGLFPRSRFDFSPWGCQVENDGGRKRWQMVGPLVPAAPVFCSYSGEVVVVVGPAAAAAAQVQHSYFPIHLSAAQGDQFAARVPLLRLLMCIARVVNYEEYIVVRWSPLG